MSIDPIEILIALLPYIVLWVTISALSALAVGAVKRIASFDVPSNRSMHTTATPRGGGLGILLTFLVIYALYALFAPHSQQSDFFHSRSMLLPIIAGGLPVAIVGWIDDRKHVSPLIRALIHIAGCAAAFAIFAKTDPVPPNVLPLNPIWLVAVTIGAAYFLNVFNFMDGLDGLAASEGLFACMAGGLIVYLSGFLHTTAIPAHLPYDPVPYAAAGIPAMILGACCLGFLFWNWPPAKIFMGDVGSGFLGFVLGFFALAQTFYDSATIWMWLILLAVFIVDGTCTLLVRAATGQRWFEAHNLHAFQKAAKLSKSHLSVTRAVNMINFFWLWPMAIVAFNLPELAFYVALVAYAPLIFLAVRYRAGIQEPASTVTSTVAQ